MNSARTKTLRWLSSRDSLLSLAFIGIALLIYFEVAHLRPDNRLLPQLVALLMACCGIALAGTSLKKRSAFAAETREHLLDRAQLVLIASTLVAVMLITVLGFYTSIFLLSLFCSLYLFRPLSLRVVVKAFVFSVILIFILYFGFRQSLGMFTPRGIFV